MTWSWQHQFITYNQHPALFFDFEERNVCVFFVVRLQSESVIHHVLARQFDVSILTSYQQNRWMCIFLIILYRFWLKTYMRNVKSVVFCYWLCRKIEFTLDAIRTRRTASNGIFDCGAEYWKLIGKGDGRIEPVVLNKANRQYFSHSSTVWYSVMVTFLDSNEAPFIRSAIVFSFSFTFDFWYISSRRWIRSANNGLEITNTNTHPTPRKLKGSLVWRYNNKLEYIYNYIYVSWNLCARYAKIVWQFKRHWDSTQST